MWGAAQGLHRLRRRIAPPAPLPQGLRTICVGNLLVGGSGKTPFTIFLAQWLQGRGESVGVALRGYRGAWERTGGLVSDAHGLRPDAELAGDEALLLAESLPGVPVAVGRDRRASIERLRSVVPGLRWVILDDAFQHLRVPHSVSFLLFSAARGLGNGLLLPAGPLREPLAAARHANAAVLVGSGDADFLKPTGLPVLRGRYVPGPLTDEHGAALPPNALQGRIVALVSGIGNPRSFEATAHEAGIHFVAHYIYPDHAVFPLPELRARMRRDGADLLVCTAKDACRLRATPGHGLPLAVLPIRLALEDNGLLDTLS